MPIKVQHGKVADIAKLGLLAGQSEAAQRQAAQAEVMTRQLLQIQHDKEMTVYRAQLDLEAAKRSQQWEVEKMEIRSRLDFERAEGERIRKLDDINNALRQIDKEVESGRITSAQAIPLRFSYEMKKHGATPPVSLIKPPKEEEPKEISPAQRMAAYKALQGEEFREPGAWDKFLQATTLGIYGKEELTEEELFYKEQFERTARGEVNIPTGTISQGLPEPKTQQEYNAIPVGERYIDSSGNIRTKS